MEDKSKKYMDMMFGFGKLISNTYNNPIIVDII